MDRKATSSKEKVSCGETLGGRDDDDRRLFLVAEAAQATPPFRFSRMGPSGVRQAARRAEPEEDRRRRWRTAAAASGRCRPGSRTSASSSTTTSPSTRPNVMLGENVTPAQLIQARSPSLDLDSLYGAGPSDPASEKFYEADKIHLKMGTAMAAGGTPAMPGYDLPRGLGGTVEREAQGDHPGPEERREPRGRAAPPRDDPLPQPRRRHASGGDPARAALRQGAPEGRQALPVDAEDGLPAAHLRARRRRTTSSTRAGRRSRSARPRCRCRRCRSSSRSRPSGSGTR